MKIMEFHKTLRDVKGCTLHIMPEDRKIQTLHIIPNIPSQYIIHRIIVHSKHSNK